MLKEIFNFLTGSNSGQKQFNQKAALSKLRTQLYSCTYYPNIKYLLEQICLSILRKYPQFDTNILAFSQNNQPRRFIQIGGKMQYQYKEKKYKVKVFMMFNQYFPNYAPYVRIVNIEHKPINPIYFNLQSPNDQFSFIMNTTLNSLVNWVPGKQCSLLFEQLKNILQNYSFYEVDQKQPKTLNSKKQQKKQQIKTNNQQYIANRGSIYQTNIKQQAPKQKKQIKQEYDKKQCKLCYNNQSNMINLSCGHIMMCDVCFNSYKKKCGSQVCQCPLCKTKGKYIKLKYA